MLAFAICVISLKSKPKKFLPSDMGPLERLSSNVLTRTILKMGANKHEQTNISLLYLSTKIKLSPKWNHNYLSTTNITCWACASMACEQGGLNSVLFEAIANDNFLRIDRFAHLLPLLQGQSLQKSKKHYPGTLTEPSIRLLLRYLPTLRNWPSSKFLVGYEVPSMQYSCTRKAVTMM